MFNFSLSFLWLIGSFHLYRTSHQCELILIHRNYSQFISLKTSYYINKCLLTVFYSLAVNALLCTHIIQTKGIPIECFHNIEKGFSALERVFSLNTSLHLKVIILLNKKTSSILYMNQTKSVNTFAREIGKKPVCGLSIQLLIKFSGKMLWVEACGAFWC